MEVIYNKLIAQLPCPYTIEIWKDLTYPGIMKGMYKVSTFGQIYSIHSNKIMNTYVNNSGYQMLHLVGEDGKQKSMLVHRLIAYEFCDPPANFQELQVNHITGRKDCNYDNTLEWTDQFENMKHCIDNDLTSIVGETNHFAVLTKDQVVSICEYLTQKKTYREIIRLIGLDENNSNNFDLIGNIKRRIAWKSVSKDYNF
jgi:hypothetical protein